MVHLRHSLAFSNASNADKYTEFAFWTESWLAFLTLIEDQPPEILDKSSLWLHPIVMPDESNLTCLPEWTAVDDDRPSPSSPGQQPADSRWSNIFSPPQVHNDQPLDLNSMSTDDILSLTNEPRLAKTKSKPAKLIDTPRGKTPFSLDNQRPLSVDEISSFRHELSHLVSQTPNKSSPSSALTLNLMSTFRNKPPMDASLASPLCTPHRTGKKLPSLSVTSSQTSSRPRRAAAIKADERIQQIHDDTTDDSIPRLPAARNSPSVQSARAEAKHREPVDALIDQIDGLHIERKLQFDDDDDEQEEVTVMPRHNDELVRQCIQLHDRLAYAPNAKLMRYLSEFIILLSGDHDPWLVATLIVEMQAIGFRYNALCIYQRKKR